MEFLSRDFDIAMEHDARYREVVDGMAKEIDAFLPFWNDSPQAMSRWGHSYFCNDDGGRLVFDPASPKRHVCEICKKVYEGEPWDGVWVYFLRNQAIVTALKSAVVYRARKDVRYLDAARTIIGFYAENYSRFVIHDKEDRRYSDIASMGWGAARIMPQSLNESIIVLRILQAMILLSDDLDDRFVSMVKELLLRPMVELLLPQVDAIHNIRCWILSALGGIALYTKDESLFTWVFASEFGMNAQLEKGVTSDGFWYEGSIHYNFFLLEGVATLMVLCDAYGAPFGRENQEIVRRMLENAYAYAFDNDCFPNPNDGWPDLNLKTFSYVYQMGAKVFGEASSIGDMLKNIESGPAVRTGLPLSESYYFGNRISLEELMFNCGFSWAEFSPVARASYDFPASDFAMLRHGSLNVFCKYGLHGPSHAHPDIMNMEIMFGGHMITRDISNAGYNSRLCREWHRRTACHNTVVMDGRDQTGVAPGRSLSFSDFVLSVENDTVYPSVVFRRTLDVVSENELSDTFLVSGDAAHTFDYVFHLESDFLLRDVPRCVAGNLGYRHDGFEYFEDCREIVRPGDSVTIRAESPHVVVCLTFLLGDGKRLFIARTPDNPVNSTRTTFVVRASGESICFKTIIQLEEKI